MPIQTERLLAHMAWANQKLFRSIQGLPQDCLDAYLVNPEWSVGHLLRHIVDGAQWNMFCLGAGKLQRFADAKDFDDVRELATELERIDAILQENGQLDDEMLQISAHGRLEQNLRSTMVSQAIYHAIEHRAQVIAALELKGYRPLALDDIDLWQFENYQSAIATNEEG